VSTLPRLIVFAAGTKAGGGSGFREIVRNVKTGVLQAHLVGVVSTHAAGGVRAIADTYGIPFIHFTGPWSSEAYQYLIAAYEATWVASSGWLKPVRGLDPRHTFNIHPGPLPRFGGRGMYGQHVHQAVLDAFQRGDVTASAVTMHFVTDFDADGDYDRGPIFFRYPVLIEANDTLETLSARINTVEHGWQSFVTNLVIHEQITWDGKDPTSLVVPAWYPFL
jgi:phosphoribosylglycinamide formyltransferase-1